jgi:hypothetical protein
MSSIQGRSKGFNQWVVELDDITVTYGHCVPKAMTKKKCIQKLIWVEIVPPPKKGILETRRENGHVLCTGRALSVHVPGHEERGETYSTDRCSDPVHPWRCHMHFIGHLWLASFFLTQPPGCNKGSALSSGCPWDYPATPVGRLPS